MTLDRWIKAGTFPRPHYLGGKRAWFEDEVAAWEESRTAQLADPANRRSTHHLRAAWQSTGADREAK